MHMLLGKSVELLTIEDEELSDSNKLAALGNLNVDKRDGILKLDEEVELFEIEFEER